MQYIDGAEISLAIDLDQGARISSLQWRDLQVVLPFRGAADSWGLFAKVPMGGHALSWEETGVGRSRLLLPPPYKGAVIEQSIEILDDAVRWIVEYEPNGVDEIVDLGLRAWFNRELERGGAAEVIGDQVIRWPGVLQCVVDCDAVMWSNDIQDSDGICIAPDYRDENYLEALLIFESLDDDLY